MLISRRNVILAVIFVLASAMVVIQATGLIVASKQAQFTLSTIDGQTQITYSSDIRMVANLPPSLEDDVIVPMIWTYGEDAGLYYRGDPALPWRFYGGAVNFTLRPIGHDGDTFVDHALQNSGGFIDIVLVQMDRQLFEAMKYYPEAEVSRVKIAQGQPATLISAIKASERLHLVGS